MKKLEEFVAKLEATGGGDECEDFIGAINKSYEVFKLSEKGFNLIIAICDSPCHGQQYHNNCGDSHLN